MNDFLIGSITGAIVLDKRRPKKKSKYPVKARITYMRDRYYLKLGFDLSEEEFIRLPKTKDRELREIKKQLIRSFDHIKSVVEEIHITGTYSHEALRTKLKRGRRAYIDAAFDCKIDELTKTGQAGTAASYSTAKCFFTDYNVKTKFIDITPNWLNKLETWALEKRDRKISETTLGIYLRCLRTLFNEAIRNGDVPKDAYPFNSKDNKGYTILKGSGTKMALTIDQIKKISALQLKPGSSLERCRDMFLLSFYLGGINFKDLLLLKWRDISNGEVTFIREKTRRTAQDRKPINVPITSQAENIIYKWGNVDKSADAYVIPHLTEGLSPVKLRDNIKSYIKQVNKQLKVIGSMEEINIQGLSTYVARHSVATILKNSGAPIAFIGETLGHSSTRTTEAYLKGFEQTQRRKHFEILTNI